MNQDSWGDQYELCFFEEAGTPAVNSEEFVNAEKALESALTAFRKSRV